MAASNRPDPFSANDAADRPAGASGASYDEILSAVTPKPRAGEGPASSARARPYGEGNRHPSSPTAPASAPTAPEGATAGGPYMMPMQQSWVAPVVPVTPSEYPLHAVFGVPRVSEATLNRYIHPLQAVGVTAAGSTEAEGDLGTSVFRVAPGGLQDFVTEDGYRHRFDVEVVFPSPSAFTWQGRDATEIHPEVAAFAATALREKMASSGMDVSKLEITPFRMKGGNAARPWFLDQLVLKMEGKDDLPVSLNVAMRDPEYTLETILSSWETNTEAARAIPS